MSQLSATVTSLSEGAERLQSLLAAFEVADAETRRAEPNADSNATPL